PSDFMVLILNAISQQLDERGLSTRIGFFLYQETWWPPKKESLHQPERFIITFCPIGRDYQTPYDEQASDSDLPDFVYNQNKRISDIRGIVDSPRQRQQQSGCDTIAFDYHLTWYHYFAPYQFEVARILAEDIRKMPDLGLEGFVS